MFRSKSTRDRQFQIRELVALTAGVALVFAIVAWVVRTGANRYSIAFVAAWGIGSIAGIIMTPKGVTVVLGSVLGGVIVPVLLFASFATIDPVLRTGTIRDLSRALLIPCGIACCASAVQAAVMGILSEGFTLRNKKERG